jgi:hypothetical protein
MSPEEISEDALARFSLRLIRLGRMRKEGEGRGLGAHDDAVKRVKILVGVKPW